MKSSKRRAGRPVLSSKVPPRTRVFRIGLSDEEAELMRSAAKRVGKPVVQWMRETIVMAALTLINPNRVLVG